ncbi:hypothetical protein V502_04359 [Pseudogymnoascus sp. VKM F-4520 (FW-2644)]|nr:hypothetical protein V502_04359 [Pseudogymnoascus sp. VKM F-4520 (FW-2644)]
MITLFGLRPTDLALVVFCITVAARVLYRQFLHPLADFPGPFGAAWTDAWWFYHLFTGRVTWKNHDWHKRYGPIVRIAPNHLSFNSPQAIKDCYGFSQSNEGYCLKDPEFFLESVYGSWNIINENTKEEHSRMRKMLSYAFSTKALLEQECVIIKSIEDFMYQTENTLSEDGKNGVNITKWFNNLTFNIMGGLAFGDSFGTRVGNYGIKSYDRYHWVSVIIESAFINDVMRCTTLVPFLPTFLDWWIPQKYQESSFAHMDYSILETQARIQIESGPKRPKDFMHYMLNFSGPKATEKEMASHINALMMAGVITTSTFLSGVIYYIMSDKVSFDKLKAELRSTFSSLEDITGRSTMKCKYLSAVIQEGLRIYPPAGGAHLPRIVPPEGKMIAGTWIPGRVSQSLPHL